MSAAAAPDWHRNWHRNWHGDWHIARRCWHLIAHRSELARDRDYLRFPWVLGELVVYNDQGSIIAFDNVCPHRGARFFLDDFGNAPALCRYHGWSYRGGQMRIPNPGAFRPCDLAAARLNQFAIAWCGAFLFVAVEPETDLATQLGDVGALLAGISSDIDRRRDFDRYVYECPWRVAVENALEPDHVNMVHADTLGLLDLSPSRNSYFDRNSIMRADITNARTARVLRSMRRFFDMSQQDEGYTAIFLFPFTFLTSTFGYSYALQNFMPALVSNQTQFSSRLLTTRPANAAAESITDPFFASVAAMNRRVFAEDHEICRRVDPNFPLDGPGRILSATEEKIGHFRSKVQASGGMA